MTETQLLVDALKRWSNNTLRLWML